MNAHPVTKNCELPYKMGEHVVFGISPLNSYFSLENIMALSHWATGHFKSFSLFIPDEPTVYTLLALGYEKEKARKKAIKQCKYLKTKCLKALANLDIPESETQEKILDFNFLGENTQYLSSLRFYEEKYMNDISFKRGCLETSKYVIQNNTQRIDDDMLEIAAKYLLAELPIFFNSAKILNKKSSVFCYRNCFPFIQHILERKSSVEVSENQGYIVVDVESDMAATSAPNPSNSND